MEDLLQSESVSLESRKKLSIFLKILDEKADLDENYALNLERISKSFTPLIDSSAVSLGFASLKSDFMLTYEHFRRLAYLARNECEIMKEVLSKQANESEKIISEQKKMEKELKIITNEVENARSFYEKAKRSGQEAELCLKSLEQLRSLESEKIRKIRIKMGNSIIEKNDRMLKYRENIDKFNIFIDEYQKAKSLNEEILSNHEINRNNLLKEIIVTLIGNETSSFKHLILDLDKILKKVEQIDSKQDLQKLKTKSLEKKNSAQKIKFEENLSFFQTEEKFHLLSPSDFQDFSEKFEKFNATLVASIDTQTALIRAKFPFDERVYFVGEALNKAWKGSQLTDKEIFEYSQLMEQTWFRRLWVLAIQEYRIQSKFEINYWGFESIIRILEDIFQIVKTSQCLKQKDLYTALKTMIMTSTFYKMEETSSRKAFLQSYLTELEIWKNLDFWKSAIFTSIINESNLQRNLHIEETENESEKQFREKNIVFGQLAAFSQNMLMFGVEKKVILHVMQKYFEIFELEESQTENLKKILDSLESKETKQRSFVNISDKKSNFLGYFAIKPKKSTVLTTETEKSINKQRSVLYKSHENLREYLEKKEKKPKKGEILTPYQNFFKGKGTVTPLRMRKSILKEEEEAYEQSVRAKDDKMLKPPKAYH